ncbi:MAG: outer membrane beta-barrel domain-containing protein, partial [Deltaproteobacteria bacterium]|nr:outer membrane beta-barrel domain-containing protein [Deltaproteobacteria bacterium]
MRTFILIAALACAAPAAFAADDKPAGSSVIVPATPSTQAAGTAGTAGTPAPGAPAAAPAAPASAAPAAEAPKSATLVGGDTADVIRIHVVEKRPFTEAGRGELSIFGPVQINSKFTTHIGAALEFAYHLRENIAVQAGVLYNPYAVQSSLTEELVTKVHQQPLAANALLLKAGAMAGLELMPVYGKINIFDGKILRIGFYLNAGLGGASTRLQIRGSNDVEGRSFGDTGVRLMAALGAGFRVFLGERFTLRLEVRDQMYS